MVAVIDRVSLDDPSLRTAVLTAAQRVSAVSGVTGVVTAHDNPDPWLRAAEWPRPS
jgi:hypothetical protein